MVPDPAGSSPGLGQSRPVIAVAGEAAMNRKTDSAAMAAAFGAKDVAELTARYAEWSDAYDAENAAAGYRMPQLCSAFFARHVPIGASPVLDAGCGTGLAGDCLHVLGYRDLVGIDLSEPMLARASRLGVYASLRQMVLGEPLDFPDDQFAAILVSGVFTEGHTPHSSFDELIRVVRDDIYEERGFRERQDKLEAEGLWRLRERSDRFRPFTVKEPDIFARIFVYEAR
jgi:predicted TPR repeat methyltransferase